MRFPLEEIRFPEDFRFSENNPCCANFGTLPDSFSNSAQMSSRDFDFGIFPTKSLVLGTDTFTLRGFPG